MSEAKNEPTFRIHQKIDKKIEKKEIEKLFLGLHCLKRIMSQLLDYTKKNKKKNSKITKIEKKTRKIIFGSELSEAKNEPIEYTKKLIKNREKRNRKIIFGSALSETNNEPTFRLHQKNDKTRKKIENYFWLRIV